MAKIKLPRYVRAKRLKGGVIGYYWEPPVWADPKHATSRDEKKRRLALRNGRTCPVQAEALGTDVSEVFAKAERRNLAFDEWRLGVEMKPVEGTVRWLFAQYREHERFKDAAAGTQNNYRRYMGVLERIQLRTTTFGEMRIDAVRAAHADALYRGLKAAQGARAAAHCMQIARRAWYEHIRDTGAPNPFARMNIKMKAKKGNRATSREEYDAFRAKARELGLQSQATAAALSFELVRRVSDVFGYAVKGDDDPGGIYWEDYVPRDRIALRQHKTGLEQIIPLRGAPDPTADDPEVKARGPLLYPDLEEELARTPRGQPDIEIDGRPFTPIVLRESTGRRYTEKTANTDFHKVRMAAGLPEGMTPTGFRHGGATELGDAGIEDIRPVSGHKTRAMADIYDKITEKKARRVGEARRAHVERGGGPMPSGRDKP